MHLFFNQAGPDKVFFYARFNGMKLRKALRMTGFSMREWKILNFSPAPRYAIDSLFNPKAYESRSWHNSRCQLTWWFHPQFANAISIFTSHTKNFHHHPFAHTWRGTEKISLSSIEFSIAIFCAESSRSTPQNACNRKFTVDDDLFHALSVVSCRISREISAWKNSPTFSHKILTWLSVSCLHSFSCSIHWSRSFRVVLSSMLC